MTDREIKQTRSVYYLTHEHYHTHNVGFCVIVSACVLVEAVFSCRPTGHIRCD